MVKTNCKYCKKEFEIWPYRLKRSKFVYCSKDCKNKDSSNLITEAHKNKKWGFGISNVGGFPKGKKNPKLSKLKKKLIGKLNPFYGRKHTKETKNNIRKSKLGQKHSIETRKLMRKNRIKEKHWNWKGGITNKNKLLRLSSMWKIWREAVFLRDKFICQNKNCKFCKNKQGVKLHPHHIKPFSLFPKLMFNINNGITYCACYHLKSGLHRKAKMEIID